MLRTNRIQPMERHMTILKLAQHAVAAAAFVAAGSAFAANPALNLVSGSGTLTVDSSAASQLTALGLSLTPVPGSATTAGLRQPVTSIAANGTNTSLTTVNFSTAGLRLGNSTTRIDLTDFSLNTTSNILTASISLNGGSSQRLGLFQASSLTGSFAVPTLTAGQSTTINVTLNDLKLTSSGATQVATLAGYGAFAGLLTGINFGDFATTVTVSAVPEPSTYALMGLGLAAAGFFARRRQQAA